MDYPQFITAIKDLVSELLPSNIHLKTYTTLKNNARERIGLSFANPLVNLSPTIYLEEFYQRFQDGLPLEVIASRIISIYNDVKHEQSLNIRTITDFDTCKGKIVYKLINAQMNQSLLENVPHLLFLDFAIVFYILYDVDDTGSATIPITNQLMQLWDTNLSQLAQLATANSPLLLPPVIKPMYEVIEELIGDTCECLNPEDSIMFVLTNPLRSYGSISMIYEGVLQDFAEKLGESFYLLPSSVHEMILVPESKSPTKDDLLDMVKEINETQLAVEEILSNRVYYYDCKRKLIV